MIFSGECLLCCRCRAEVDDVEVDVDDSIELMEMVDDDVADV